MTPIQALDIIHQMRLKYECNGQSHDLIREAFRVLKELVDQSHPGPATSPPPISNEQKPEA